MDVLHETPFFDFGTDPLYPFARTGLKQLTSESTQELRSQVRGFVPRQSGVYGMLDALGRLIYIGKSKVLRNRLLSYFLPNNEEDKAGRIIQSTQSIVWETQPNEFAALLREQSLIRHFQPRFNVQGIPKRQQPIFICLGRSPAEQLYTSRRPEPDAVRCIGPLMGSARAARAVEVLNRVFRLRDCSSKQPCSFTDQLQLFEIEMRPGCIRLEIQSCLGPCISACSRREYEGQVQLARMFLDGLDETPVEAVDLQMQHAAQNFHYEQAAVLREDLRCVQWLHRRVCELSRARNEYSFVYPVVVEASQQSARQREIWYLIRKGVIEGAIAKPNSRDETTQAIRLLKQWFSEDQRIGDRFSPWPETLALVSSWFRNNRKELKTTFRPDDGRRIAARARAGRGKPSAVKV